MPELPEVQTVVSDLAEVLPQKKIQHIQIFWDRSIANISTRSFLKAVTGKTIRAVSRRAKFIVLHCTDQSLILVHLRMTGQLFWRKHTSPSLHHEDYCRVQIEFTDSSLLLFCDIRKFGKIYFFQSTKECEQKVFSKLGLEPLAISAEQFAEVFQERKGSIKAHLLRQDLVCGLGNIYVDESLFASQIHPESQIQKIPKGKLQELHEAIQNILQSAIDLRGTSMRDYLDITGNAGKYKQILKVYQQDETPCVHCGSTIKKIRVAGRGTHVCAKCQKKY